MAVRGATSSASPRLDKAAPRLPRARTMSSLRGGFSASLASPSSSSVNFHLQLEDEAAAAKNEAMQARKDTIETLRSRKPIFTRLRDAQLNVRHLTEELANARATIRTLQTRLLTDSDALNTLERESERVQCAAKDLGKTIDDTTDIDIILPGDAAAATRPELAAWAEYGVSQIFHTFNSRHDGVLCLQDMNHLQAALGNTTPYTLREYRALCNTHSLTWHWIRDPGVPPDLAGDSMPVSLLVTPQWAQSERSKPQGGLDGGLDANGLIALYAQMGEDCVKRDLALLGIMPDVRSKTIRAIARAAERLQRLHTKLRAAHAHNLNTASTLRSSKVRVREQERAIAQMKARIAELERDNESLRGDNTRLCKQHGDLSLAGYQQQEVLDHTLSQHQNMTLALQRMRTLLTKALDDKDRIHRRLVQMEARHGVMEAAVRQSQVVAWKQSTKLEEQQRQHRLLLLQQQRHGGKGAPGYGSNPMAAGTVPTQVEHGKLVQLPVQPPPPPPPQAQAAGTTLAPQPRPMSESQPQATGAPHAPASAV